jgi:hypothetical protein
MYLVGDTNDTASGAGTGVTGLLGLLVSALAEVVGAGVDNNGALWKSVWLYVWRKGKVTYANDALGADELDQLVLDAALGVTLAVGLEVTEVTDVTLLVAGGTVGLVVRVDWRWSAHVHDCRHNIVCAAYQISSALTVRSGRSAAVSVVTEGVDVHATLSVGIVASDIP